MLVKRILSYLFVFASGLVLKHLSDEDFWSITGLVFTGFVFIRTFKKIGQYLPLADFIILIMLFQWFVAPSYDYMSGVEHFRYYMRVPRDVYMAFTVPSIIVFSFFLESTSTPLLFFSVDQTKLWKKLLLIGLLSHIFYSIVPASFRFILFLLQGLVYVAAILKYYNTTGEKRFVPLVLALFWLVYSAFSSGYFHTSFLWILFISPFVFNRERLGYSSKIFTLLAAFILILFIQFVKSPLRLALQYGVNPITFVLNTDFDLDRLLGSPDEMDALNARFNQGWIISTVLSEVPENIPFARGATIWEAIQASALPRFLAPNKKLAGGRENFEKYTGLQLTEGTSMGISILGEAYANFGKFGGVLFMAIWGLFLGWVLRFISILGIKNNFLVYFVPILFFQVIKAETELVVVLNHLIKASLLIWGLFTILNLKGQNHQDSLVTSPKQ